MPLLGMECFVGAMFYLINIQLRDVIQHGYFKELKIALDLSLFVRQIYRLTKISKWKKSVNDKFTQK